MVLTFPASLSSSRLNSRKMPSSFKFFWWEAAEDKICKNKVARKFSFNGLIYNLSKCTLVWKSFPPIFGSEVPALPSDVGEFHIRCSWHVCWDWSGFVALISFIPFNDYFCTLLPQPRTRSVLSPHPNGSPDFECDWQDWKWCFFSGKTNPQLHTVLNINWMVNYLTIACWTILFLSLPWASDSNLCRSANLLRLSTCQKH